MKKSLISAAVALAAFAYGLPVGAADNLVRFDGGIGVIPVSSVAGVQNANGTFPDVNRNDVRGVPPGGQPWVIASLQADVRTNGRIRVDGRGLLLAGGNNVGFNANASVFATLFCGNIEHSTDLAGVPLEPNGDFRINDVLSPVPAAPCEGPVLLVRTSNGGRWFAAGIPRL